jgi:sulfate transport system substrate-binding protein
LHQPGATEKTAEAYLKKLYANVPVLDTGARGATTTFVQRGIGDVLLSWENEAHLAVDELGAGKFDIVVPSLSILAEPPVAVVDRVTLRRKTTDLARAYLEYLYSPEAQAIIAKHHYRPRNEAVLKKYSASFPDVKMLTIADFGGWPAAQKKHFDDGGLFDQIYLKK